MLVDLVSEVILLYVRDFVSVIFVVFVIIWFYVVVNVCLVKNFVLVVLVKFL